MPVLPVDSSLLKHLNDNHVSSTDDIFDSDNRDKLAEALDPKWEGPLPCTILIAPRSEIVRRWQEPADPAELRMSLPVTFSSAGTLCHPRVGVFCGGEAADGSAYPPLKPPST